MLNAARVFDRIEPMEEAPRPAREAPWGLTWDSALLCRHVWRLIESERLVSALDVGCSIGLTTAWSAWRRPGVRITGIDTHGGAIAAASRLRMRAGLDGEISFRCTSYRDMGGETFGLVFANPPYIPNLLDLSGMDASAVGTRLLEEMLEDPFRHVARGGRMALVMSSTTFACCEIRKRVESLDKRRQARRVSRTLIPFNVTSALAAPAFVAELEGRGAIVRRPGCSGYFHAAEVWEFAET